MKWVKVSFLCCRNSETLDNFNIIAHIVKKHYELAKIKDEDKKYKQRVELNVQEQCINLIKTPEVQKALRQDQLEVHGWVCDIKSGKLIDLEINFDKVLKDIMKIYRLEMD